MATKQTLTATTLYLAGTLTYDQATAYAGGKEALDNALKQHPTPRKQQTPTA